MVEQGGEENDMEWILEIMAEYLQSPVWKNPIIGFVEEKCIIFENQDENSLEYTEIHQQFKSLVEHQLEAYIQDLGISQQDFVLAQSRASKRIHKSCLEQLMAVEDFLLFKRMMVNRNIQMNKDAMAAMKKKGGKTDRISKAVEQSSSEEESSEEDEEEMMRRAIEESKKSAEAEEGARRNAAEEAAKANAQAREAERQAIQQAAADQAANEAAKQADMEARAKKLQARIRAAKAQKEAGANLPDVNKPKRTGLSLKDVEIKEGDGEEVKEMKSQSQALKMEKDALIAQRNQQRQEETAAAAKARQAAAETEDQAAKAARIQRGLQALSLAPTDDSKAEQRVNMYKNLRSKID